MPEIYIEKVTAAQLRKGDVLVVPDEPDSRVTIERVTPKQVWTYILLEGAQRAFRAKLDDTYTVERSRLTEEEAAVNLRDSTLRDLDRSERMDRRNLAAARAAIRDAMSEESGGQLLPGMPLQVWTYTARVKLWDIVHAVHLRRCEFAQTLPGTAVVDDVAADVEGFEPISRIDAVKNVRDRVQRDILQHLRMTSRSSSMSHNFMEDCEVQGKLDWLEELRWGVDLIG
jgi:hypothetical protein